MCRPSFALTNLTRLRTMRQMRRYTEVAPTLSPTLLSAMRLRMLQYDHSFTMRKCVLSIS